MAEHDWRPRYQLFTPPNFVQTKNSLSEFPHVVETHTVKTTSFYLINKQLLQWLLKPTLLKQLSSTIYINKQLSFYVSWISTHYFFPLFYIKYKKLRKQRGEIWKVTSLFVGFFLPSSIFFHALWLKLMGGG